MDRDVGKHHCQCETGPDNRLHDLDSESLPASHTHHKSPGDKHECERITACGPLPVQCDLAFEREEEREKGCGHQHRRINAAEYSKRARRSHALLVILNVRTQGCEYE